MRQRHTEHPLGTGSHLQRQNHRQKLKERDNIGRNNRKYREHDQDKQSPVCVYGDDLCASGCEKRMRFASPFWQWQGMFYGEFWLAMTTHK